MARYAENTSVAVDRSVAEIQATLQRYGAEAFGHMTRGRQAMVMFEVDGRQVRMMLELPDPDDREFTTTPKGKPRGSEPAWKAWEQACRQRWRALALVIKAKLEAVQCGISTVEREFFADLMLPGGQTVHQMMAEKIHLAYETGKVPAIEFMGGRGRPRD